MQSVHLPVVLTCFKFLHCMDKADIITRVWRVKEQKTTHGEYCKEIWNSHGCRVWGTKSKWKYFPKLTCHGMLCVFKLCIPNPWLVTPEISHAVLEPLSLKGDFRVAGCLFLSGAPILLMFWWQKSSPPPQTICPSRNTHAAPHVYTRVALM